MYNESIKEVEYQITIYKNMNRVTNKQLMNIQNGSGSQPKQMFRYSLTPQLSCYSHLHYMPAYRDKTLTDAQDKTAFISANILTIIPIIRFILSSFQNFDCS